MHAASVRFNPEFAHSQAIVQYYGQIATIYVKRETNGS